MANWISETEACKKVMRHPRTLRKLVKKGTWNVSYRTVNGRTYSYLEKDLDKVFEQKIIKP